LQSDARTNQEPQETTNQASQFNPKVKKRLQNNFHLITHNFILIYVFIPKKWNLLSMI